MRIEQIWHLVSEDVLGKEIVSLFKKRPHFSQKAHGNKIVKKYPWIDQKKVFALNQQSIMKSAVIVLYIAGLLLIWR